MYVRSSIKFLLQLGIYVTPGNYINSWKLHGYPNCHKIVMTICRKAPYGGNICNSGRLHEYPELHKILWLSGSTSISEVT